MSIGQMIQDYSKHCKRFTTTAQYATIAASEVSTQDTFYLVSVTSGMCGYRMFCGTGKSVDAKHKGN